MHTRKFSPAEFALLAAVRASLSLMKRPADPARERSAGEQSAGERPLRLLVAVSGGSDSVVLFDALLRLTAEGLAADLGVAHVNHGLRAQAPTDEQFVRSLAQDAGVPCYVHRPQGPAAGENIEAWGRVERYRFFAEVSRLHSFDAVVTAHHLHDQAETILMRLISGRLLTAAHGVAKIDRGAGILRPLHGVSKELILAYRQMRGLLCVEDSSNADRAFTRNRIRSELLPALAADYNPSIVETAALTAARLGQDEAALAVLVEELFEKADADASRSYLRNLLPALKWRYLRCLAIKQAGPSARCLGYEAYQIVGAALDQRNGSKRSFDLGFGVQARVSRNEVEFVHRESAGTRDAAVRRSNSDMDE